MSACKNLVPGINGDCLGETVTSKASLSEKNSKPYKKPYKPHIVWEGTDKDTECEMFKRYVLKRYNLNFESDKDFHRWSVERLKEFWDAVWNYFEIIASKPYKEVFVRTGPGFLDYDWFSEARFNIAENLMRFRDDTIALICDDEEGNTDRVTFAELYEEVKLYAAAFRKHGLQKGDRVACQMSNRKEAIFAMLATFSVGGLWACVIPFLGAKASGNIVNRINPKFLVTMDRCQHNGIEYNMLGNLPTIIENTPTLEKVIIVPTKESTSQKSISHIKSSCLLQDFLVTGKLNNTVPDLVFEQLPASHPVILSFTSGTTGISKGTVHSARILISALTDVSFSYNLKRGDVLFCHCPMGWAPILGFSQALQLGVSMYLYAGSLTYERKSWNVWNVIRDHKISFILLIPSELDKLEKMKVSPTKPIKPCDSLKVIAIGGCPVKPQNIKYVLGHMPKNTFVGNFYGATESFGFFSGAYLKSPALDGEIQLPCLGLDIKSFTDEGLPVVGKLGTAVITSPSPCFPLYLWKDVDNTIMNQSYLSKFPGVWCQNDVCWINPETNGIRIKGRSDVAFVQNGDKFGPEDIYFAIYCMAELEDYICVSYNTLEGDELVILFVKLKPGYELTPSLIVKIKDTIMNELHEDCVPHLVKAVKDVPYNMSNKRMESTVKKILANNEIPEMLNIRNPECLKSYCNIPELMNS